MAKPLLIYFREERQFDRQLWMSYFTLGVAFLSQPDLQLERMTGDGNGDNCGEGLARHRMEQERGFGDMRMKMAFQILSLWSHLGELKQNFIPGGSELKEGELRGEGELWVQYPIGESYLGLLPFGLGLVMRGGEWGGEGKEGDIEVSPTSSYVGVKLRTCVCKKSGFKAIRGLYIIKIGWR